MPNLTFNININGYWRDKNKKGLPSHSGVYFVYEAQYVESNDTVSLLKLIYIGEAGNVNERILVHEKYALWQRYVNPGNELCFSTGYIESSNRCRVEAAYIFRHKPPANSSCKEAFSYDTTTVVSSGKTALLDHNFTVNRTL